MILQIFIIFPIVIILILLIIYIWYKRNFSYWHLHRTVPSAKASFFSGSLWDCLTFKTNFGFHLKTIYDDEQFQNESVVGVYALHRPALLIRDPELIKHVFIKNFDCFPNRISSTDPHADPLGGQSIFFAKYAQWKELRTKLTGIFTAGKFKLIYPLIEKAGNSLEQHLSQQGDSFVAELKIICSLFTCEVAASTIFGVDIKPFDNSNDNFFEEALQLIHFNMSRALNFLVISFIPELRTVLKPKIFYKHSEKFLRHSIKYVIEERERTQVKRNDLIDIYVKLKQEAEQNNENMDRFMDALCGTAGIMIVGGFETSSAAIANILFEMAKHPKMQQRLRAEIQQALLHGNGSLSLETIQQLEYLDMVTCEVLRLYPLFSSLEREYIKSENKKNTFQLPAEYNYDLPQGMPVYISIYGLHHDTKYWKNPENFDPERFSSTNKHLINHMTYLPFGAGPHNCIGLRMGLLQVKIGVVHFLKNHYVNICEKTVLNPKFDPKSFIIQGEGGIYLHIERDNMYYNAK